MHYVRNKDLLEAFRKWRKTKKEGDHLSDEILKMAMSIAERLLNHRHFRGYPKELKEDMMSNGLLCVVKYAKNFDPDKSNNPFAYLTQILKNGYYQVSQKEYKNQAKAISYFLENTDNVDLTNDYYELLNNNLEANKKSEESKKQKKENNKNKLFSDYELDEDLLDE